MRYAELPLLVGALLVSLGSSSPAPAVSPPGASPLEPAASRETLEISAESAELDPASGALRLSGNVTLQASALVLSSERVEVRYAAGDRANPRWIKGEGGVELRLKATRARAQTFELDADTHTLTLGGGVELDWGGASARAERASVDTRSGRLSLQRVRATLALPAPGETLPPAGHKQSTR
jgi:lipopolysaccharide export system protein LptA